MKKTLLMLGVITTLFSCSKDEEAALVVPDQTGTAVVSGIITRSDVNTGQNVAVEGAVITVKVLNALLYPDANNVTGSKVYSATTNADGKYTVNVTVNGNGVNAEVSYSSVEIITDPTIGATQNFGKNGTDMLTLTSGVSTTHSVMYTTVATIDLSSIVIETATISGNVKEYSYFDLDGDLTFTRQDSVMAGVTVFLKINQDPTTLAPRVYETTTDAEGNYSFVVDCANASYNLDQDCEIYINSFAADRVTNSVGDSESGHFNKEWDDEDLVAGDFYTGFDFYYHYSNLVN